MKKQANLIFLLIFLTAGLSSFSQKVDSIFFNLYTDSLKKGTFNYINVDGKKSGGGYLPLTAKELNFSCSSGSFEGNSLFIDKDFKEEKVTVKATLKNDTAISRVITIYIKKYEEIPKLKTKKEVMRSL